MATSAEFEVNPIGISFDPERMVAAWRDGADHAELHPARRWTCGCPPTRSRRAEREGGIEAAHEVAVRAHGSRGLSAEQLGCGQTHWSVEGLGGGKAGQAVAAGLAGAARLA
jgi:hypothetical protein